MRFLLFFFLSPLNAQIFSPVPIAQENAGDRNFRSVIDEQARQDLTAGGTIQGNVVISSVGTGITFPDGTIQTTAAGSQGLIQFISSITAGAHTGNQTIPFDDSLPLITEGFQVLSATITPTNASNRLIVDAIINAASTAAGYHMTISLFRDDGATVVAAETQGSADADRIINLKLRYIVAAGSTAQTFFSVRVGGSSAGDTTVNGISAGTRRLGGVLMSSLTITEVEP